MVPTESFTADITTTNSSTSANNINKAAAYNPHYTTATSISSPYPPSLAAETQNGYESSLPTTSKAGQGFVSDAYIKSFKTCGTTTSSPLQATYAEDVAAHGSVAHNLQDNWALITFESLAVLFAIVAVSCLAWAINGEWKAEGDVRTRILLVTAIITCIVNPGLIMLQLFLHRMPCIQIVWWTPYIQTFWNFHYSVVWIIATVCVVLYQSHLSKVIPSDDATKFNNGTSLCIAFSIFTTAAFICGAIASVFYIRSSRKPVSFF